MGISLGLVGLGSFGSAFAKLFKCHPLVDRFALCDREPERLARFTEDPFFADKLKSADAYTSLDDICRSDLDAIAIITQPWLHARQAVQALEAGKHVYSAVPIAWIPDGDEILDWCDKLVETSRRAGRFFMLGETTFYRAETMYCRRRAAEGAFGTFVLGEGEYLHDVDSPGCNLRQVRASRQTGQAGREWLQTQQTYWNRGLRMGPMHYPTHSVSGPMSVMRAHAVKVCAWAGPTPEDDDYFEHSCANETALFHMSNGAVMRICEYRWVAHPCREGFNLYGSAGSFIDGQWVTRDKQVPLTIEQMRDPLPPKVFEAFKAGDEKSDAYGGHGGSHAYLVNEFVDAVASERQPAINIWEAVRYMAAGVMAHKSALRDGEVLQVPDWGDAPE